MTYINKIEVADATGPIKKIYDGSASRSDGKVAEIVQVMSLDAAVCKKAIDLYLEAVCNEKSLDRATREMLATVVSNVNDCYY